MNAPYAPPQTSTQRIDQLDADIVARLRADPLIANADLARDFGVSNATIGARITRLRDLGMARVVAATPVSAAGFGVLAMLSARVAAKAMPKLDEVARQLAAVPQVIAVSSQLAEEPLLFSVMARDMDDLERLMEESLGRVNGIDHLGLNLMSRTHKERTDIGYRKDVMSDAEDRFALLSTTPLVERLSDVELRLLSEFQADGRMSVREAARRVGVSEATARSKLRNMREAGYLVFVTETHPPTFGLSRTAIVRLEVDHKVMSSAIEALVARPEISIVQTLVGGDFRIQLVVHTEALANFVQRVLYPLKGVRRVAVSSLVRGYKHDTNWIMSASVPNASDGEFLA